MVSEGGVRVVDGGEYVGDMVSIYDSVKQTMRHGIRQGVGVCTWVNGSIYSGNWLDGMRQGQGTFTDMQGKVYEGLWKND